MTERLLVEKVLPPGGPEVIEEEEAVRSLAGETGVREDTARTMLAAAADQPGGAIQAGPCIYRAQWWLDGTG